SHGLQLRGRRARLRPRCLMSKPFRGKPGGLIIAASLLLTVCSSSDKVINVAGDDPGMSAALAKARGPPPPFWHGFQKREHGETDFSLKVRITDDKGTEHFWLIDLARQDGKVTGTINNDPNVVARVKLGDRIEVPETDISDWLYMRNGKMVGNETLKPLLKKM